MQQFLLCFNAIMPLVLLMLLGFFLKRIQFIPEAGFKAIDKLCFKIFIPVMLFSNVYYSDFSQDFQPKAVLFMECSLILIFLLSFFLVPRVLKCSNEISATVVHGLTHGNLAVLGLPLIQNLFGTEQMAVYSILMACISPFINPMMVYEHIYFQGDKLAPWKMVRDVLSSPFLIGTVTGMVFNALNIPLPAFAATAVSNVRSIASPLCLIALGGSFALKKLDHQAGIAIGTVLLKCIVIPVFVMGAAVLLGFRGITLASLMILFCCPSATATYSFCTGYCGSPSLAAQIVVLSTVFSMFSMFAWLFFFLRMGLF